MDLNPEKHKGDPIKKIERIQFNFLGNDKMNKNLKNKDF